MPRQLAPLLISSTISHSSYSIYSCQPSRTYKLKSGSRRERHTYIHTHTHEPPVGAKSIKNQRECIIYVCASAFAGTVATLGSLSTISTVCRTSPASGHTTHVSRARDDLSVYFRKIGATDFLPSFFLIRKNL